MRMPNQAMGTDTLLDTYGPCQMTPLQTDPDLAGLAVRNRKDAALDEAVLAFNHAVLEYVHKDRGTPLYLKHVPDGLREVTAASPVTRAVEGWGGECSERLGIREVSIMRHASVVT
jgi:hypothetical protein